MVNYHCVVQGCTNDSRMNDNADKYPEIVYRDNIVALIRMCNMKTLPLLVWKLWPRLKVLSTQPTRTRTPTPLLWHKLPRHSSRLAYKCHGVFAIILSLWSLQRVVRSFNSSRAQTFISHKVYLFCGNEAALHKPTMGPTYVSSRH